jgi:hypothetical protein
MVSYVIFTDIDVRYVDGSEDQFTVDTIAVTALDIADQYIKARSRSVNLRDGHPEGGLAKNLAGSKRDQKQGLIHETA